MYCNFNILDQNKTLELIKSSSTNLYVSVRFELCRKVTLKQAKNATKDTLPESLIIWSKYRAHCDSIYGVMLMQEKQFFLE